MAGRCQAVDFEWIPAAPIATNHDTVAKDTNDAMESFHFLKEGYLNITEEDSGHTHNATPTLDTRTTIRKISDSSIKGTWKRRWCVLSEISDSIHLLYYKDHTTFTNLETPCGVLLLEGCNKLYTIPTHSKSRNVFAISLLHRNILFYTDKESELDSWLEAFQAALNLLDASNHSPLKGLPKQKALRKDLNAHTCPQELDIPLMIGALGVSSGHERPSREIPVIPKENSTSDDKNIKVLSIKSISLEDDEKVELSKGESLVVSDKAGVANSVIQVPKAKEKISKKDSNHDNTKELKKHSVMESKSPKSKEPIQILGFRMLNT